MLIDDILTDYYLAHRETFSNSGDKKESSP